MLSWGEKQGNVEEGEGGGGGILYTFFQNGCQLDILLFLFK